MNTNQDNDDHYAGPQWLGLVIILSMMMPAIAGLIFAFS